MSRTEEVDEACVNWWHPIHLSGWTKTYNATYEGATGTATEQGLDPIVLDDGTTLYRFRDAIFNDANEGYDSTQVVGCDYDGGEGMFLATLTGPGPVWLQSLPFSRMAGRMLAAAPQGGGQRRGEGSILGGLGDILGGDRNF